MEGNGAQGVLSRDGARPSIMRCSIRCNVGYGVLLKDGGGDFRANTLAREPLAVPRSMQMLSIPRAVALLWPLCAKCAAAWIAHMTHAVG